MEKNKHLKGIICGVALLALVFARPVLSEDYCDGECPQSHCPDTPPPCDYDECPPLPPCEEVQFSPGEPTQKFDFGTGHFIKITANVIRPFTLAIQFVPISSVPSPNPDLDPRLNSGLGPANCIPYDGATSNSALGTCGFYHVVEPLPTQGEPDCTDCDYSGDVLYKVFWDFPTLDQLNNVRLYRAPIPVDNDPAPDCTGDGSGFDSEFCYTQDLTDTVYPVGATGNADPGVSGKGKKFSDYEVVDRTGDDLTAKVRIGLKWPWDTGIKFDLKAVVKRNGIEVSSGELLGSPGAGVLFQNAKLRTIPLSFPTQTFAGGDNISIKVLVRNSCLGSPQLTGVARLWYDDNSMSRVTVAGMPTLYLVRGDDNEREDWDHDRDRGDLSTTTSRPKKKRDVRVWPKVPSCDGPYRSFGNWSGTVPYP